LIKSREIKSIFNVWSILSFIFVLLIILPTLNVSLNLFNETSENWGHIKEYLLLDYIVNTLSIVVFVGVLTLIIGTSLAWLVTSFKFPLSRFYKWSLLLPLAVPPYVAGFTYHGILNYTGVIQTFLRKNLNMNINQNYFNIMNHKGAIFILTVVLYPYVFAIVRSYLAKQSADLIENGRVLGKSPMNIFFKVVFPISRPAIIGGVSLVILEILNEFGLFNYFGIATFSVAIFRTWFGLSDLDSAIRLAAIVMLMVLVILLSEKLMRGRKRYGYTSSKIRPIQPIELTGIKKVFATMYCSIIFGFGFLVPTVQLLHWSLLTYKEILNIKFLEYLLNSLKVSTISTIIIVVISIIIANYSRINENILTKIYTRVTILGYSIPGAVIAVAVMIFFIDFDNKTFALRQMISANTTKLYLSTTLVMLLFAYVIRFLGIGYNSIESGFDKIGKSYFEASRMLGMSVTKTFFKIDLPMIKPAIISGFILVFIDIVKELPLTMILRTFNFHTLATKAYQYANDEMIHEAAISSMFIIIISGVLIYLLNKNMSKGGRRNVHKG